MLEPVPSFWLMSLKDKIVVMLKLHLYWNRGMNLIWRLSDIVSEKFEKKGLEYLLSKPLDHSTRLLGSVAQQFLILQLESFCPLYTLVWHFPNSLNIWWRVCLFPTGSFKGENNLWNWHYTYWIKVDFYNLLVQCFLP